MVRLAGGVMLLASAFVRPTGAWALRAPAAVAARWPAAHHRHRGLSVRFMSTEGELEPIAGYDTKMKIVSPGKGAAVGAFRRPPLHHQRRRHRRHRSDARYAAHAATRSHTTNQVKAGDTVTVHATGVVKETDKKFWSTKDPGQQPFTYQAGVG